MSKLQEVDKAGNGSHRSSQQGGQDRGIEPSDPVPALQQGQVQEAYSEVLKMGAAGESSRSIAVEMALLFLRELEPTSGRRSGPVGLDRSDPLLCGDQARWTRLRGNTGTGFLRNTKKRT